MLLPGISASAELPHVLCLTFFQFELHFVLLFPCFSRTIVIYLPVVLKATKEIAWGPLCVTLNM